MNLVNMLDRAWQSQAYRFCEDEEPLTYQEDLSRHMFKPKLKKRLCFNSGHCVGTVRLLALAFGSLALVAFGLSSARHRIQQFQTLQNPESFRNPLSQSVHSIFRH